MLKLPAAPFAWPSECMILPMKYLVGLLAIVVLVAGATYKGYDYFQEQISTSGGGGPGGGRDGGVISTGTTSPTSLPNSNQVIIVGSVTSLHAEGAIIRSLLMPLTITTPQRGSGAGAGIQGVQVDGATTGIDWDAGTPLAMDGQGGALVTGPVTVDADPSNTTIGLGSSPMGFVSGTYTLRSSVAIGNGSLARAADSVTFSTTDSSSIVFRGDASTTFPTRALQAKGSGAFTVSGELTVVKPDGSQTKIASASLDGGQFDLQMTPGSAGLQLKVTLQGNVTTA